MKLRVKFSIFFFLTGIFMVMHLSSSAQIDSAKKSENFIGKMIDNFKKDSTEEHPDQLKTNEQK